MIYTTCLLDTGPLVAYFSKQDDYHSKAVELFKRAKAPLITCEAVLTEAAFLLEKVHPRAPEDLLAFGKKRFFKLDFRVAQHWERIQILKRKYQKVPMSLADACLVVCAEQYDTPYILSFDSDFHVYRWGRHRHFKVLGMEN